MGCSSGLRAGEEKKEKVRLRKRSMRAVLSEQRESDIAGD
jgi:hypothetical protein